MNTHSNEGPQEFWRWLLHECVRANPCYVISAMFLAYAVMQLNAEIDPQVGKASGAVAILVLLQAYELALLAVAAAVMIRRPGGGRDMHGLTIVAAVFLAGSFASLDELANSFPAFRFAILAGALALAAVKMECYARLPGVLLPLRYRASMLAILGVHALPALLAKCDALDARACAIKQGAAWLAGWLSLLPLIWLAWRDGRARIGVEENAQADPLATRRCAGAAVGIVAVLSCAHLISGDWIADQRFDAWRLLPEVQMLAAAAIVLRWRKRHALGNWAAVLSMVPFGILLAYGVDLAARTAVFDWMRMLNTEAQAFAAALVFYVALALGTGLKRFYFAPGLALSAVLAEWLGKLRTTVPYFRTIAAAAMGFGLLVVGMLVSLYRERILKRIKFVPGPGGVPPKSDAL